MLRSRDSRKPTIVDQDTTIAGWRYALLSDGTLVYTECPECKTQGLVNRKVEYHDQVESSGSRGVSRESNLVYAGCNHCGADLYTTPG